MSDSELLKSAELALRAAENHVDMKRSQALDPLITQLASHPLVLERMPPKDLAKLFIALRKFGDSRLDDLRGRVDTALAEGIAKMELNTPVAPPGSTPAGVRAAFVDRLNSLKEDVETLSLLANDPGNVQGEGPAERAARHAAMRALPKTIVKLAEVMLQGTEEKSTRIISTAVELAKVAHATLLKLDPQASPDLQAFMTAALLTPELKPQVKDAELICAGHALSAIVAQGVIKESNAVSEAAGRRVDGADTPNNREILNVQLFRRALGFAYRPEWSESTVEGAFTTAGLFGDGKTWPAAGVVNLKAEMSRDKKHWDEDNVESIKDLLTLLEGFHAIGSAGRLTQQEAERLAAPLQALVLKHELGEHLGSTTTRYRWDLSQLKKLKPEERAATLREWIAPARVKAQQQVVDQATAARATAATKKKVERESKERQARRMAAGVKADTSGALKEIEKYEERKRLEAEKAAMNAVASDAVRPEPPVNP